MENFIPENSIRNVKSRFLFFLHFLIYVLVTCALVMVNVLVTPEKMWSKWVIIGWGLAVLFHELAVFVFARARR